MRLVRAAAAAAVLLVVFPVAAEEADGGVDLVGGLSVGITQLSFDEALDIDVSFHTYTLFGSASLGKAYASVSYADSLNRENVSEENEIGEATRSDLDLTVGYRLTDAWTFFLGYKDGETDLDLEVRDSTVVQNEYYREDGVYGGATYTRGLGRAGSLNFTLAYVAFDSDLLFAADIEEDDDEEEDEEDGQDEPPEFDDLEGRFSSDSNGFSAGVSWVIPVGRNLAFRSQYKIIQYDLEVTGDGMKFEPDQRLSYFDVGLLYAF